MKGNSSGQVQDFFKELKGKKKLINNHKILVRDVREQLAEERRERGQEAETGKERRKDGQEVQAGGKE